MVFNSFSYLIFFPTIVAIYFATPFRFRWIVVLVGSYFFYMSWKPIYGLLLFFTTAIDWSLALLMERYDEKGKKKTVLVISLIMNLGVLAFFKYFNFISISFWELFNLQSEPLLLKIILPIGISFYTFQSLAYMIDVYRGELAPERNFGRYAAFVSFFPHLVSGPILRPSNIIPQLHEKKEWKSENIKTGVFLIATGLIKKVVIADNLSFLVNRAYDIPGSLSGATLWLATYFFAFQIYCDFAGYTDVAIGSAKILGYNIPDNFRQPYFSQTIPEFWRRWHISLSSWLRDYLYIPLGGSRVGNARIYLNLMITMLLGGLWHGASWTFVFWGFLQGLFLSLSKLTMAMRDKFFAWLRLPDFLKHAWRIFFTFNLVCLTWIFFRAESIHEAFTIVKNIFTNFGSLQYSVFSRFEIIFAICSIVVLIIFDLLESRKLLSLRLTALPWYYHIGFAYVALLILMVFGVQQGPQFIYFQF